MNIIIKALESKYPYTYSAEHDASGNVPLDSFSTVPACPLAEFGPFGVCLNANCQSATTPDEIAACTLEHCLQQFTVLSDECWACSSKSGPAFSDILQRFVFHSINIPKTSKIIVICRNRIEYNYVKGVKKVQSAIKLFFCQFSKFTFDDLTTMSAIKLDMLKKKHPTQLYV